MHPGDTGCSLGISFISQDLKMPKEKPLGGAKGNFIILRFCKRNGEKRALILLILSYEYHGEGGNGSRKENVWNCRSQARHRLLKAPEGQFASEHLQQDSLFH